MNEQEKMKQELWYNASDNTLLKLREEAKELCFQINHTSPKDTKLQTLFHQLLPHKENSSIILPPFYTDYGTNCIIGKNTFINHNAYFMDGGIIQIGKNCQIGPNCQIYTALHPLDAATRNTGLELAKPATIQDNVWIGGNVTICPNVTIGKNSVIGAGSVVTRDIPDHSLAVGNPCKVIKKLED